jgi:DNA replication protein DnaC
MSRTQPGSTREIPKLERATRTNTRDGVRDFWEICEDRHQVRSTILTSQLPVSRWHEQIGDPTLADGILDRLVHNAHRIEMRKNRGKPNVQGHNIAALSRNPTEPWFHWIP